MQRQALLRSSECPCINFVSFGDTRTSSGRSFLWQWRKVTHEDKHSRTMKPLGSPQRERSNSSLEQGESWKYDFHQSFYVYFPVFGNPWGQVCRASLHDLEGFSSLRIKLFELERIPAICNCFGVGDVKVYQRRVCVKGFLLTRVNLETRKLITLFYFLNSSWRSMMGVGLTSNDFLFFTFFFFFSEIPISGPHWMLLSLSDDVLVPLEFDLLYCAHLHRTACDLLSENRMGLPQKNLRTELPFDPGVLILDVWPRELKDRQKGNVKYNIGPLGAGKNLEMFSYIIGTMITQLHNTPR